MSSIVKTSFTGLTCQASQLAHQLNYTNSVCCWFYSWTSIRPITKQLLLSPDNPWNSDLVFCTKEDWFNCIFVLLNWWWAYFSFSRGLTLGLWFTLKADGGAVCSGLCWQFLNKPDIIFFRLMLLSLFLSFFCGIDFFFFFFSFQTQDLFFWLGILWTASWLWFVKWKYIQLIKRLLF